ncbi:hypothetical protein K431DRAFT_285847 [Polychaeton citri CBS 116435]|uniref:BSD domain-containing protein n=1 Tax=Polychaeton citri CBS 116435 TaxID=1314669 RepID=A0A9P4UP18_9PEZI|nr:hypothetical protein K431DRAFT_285847 [Polychaeton citri CBS 116435]
MPLRATVVYKKKDGSLTVSDDRKYLFWVPASPPNASPSVTIPIATITNLQQTPESSPKVALKVFVDQDNYVFSFSRDRAEAKKEQEVVTDTLRDVIAAAKAGQAQQVMADRTQTSAAVASAAARKSAQGMGDGQEGQSAAMAMAKAVASRAQGDEKWYDDNKLKNDIQLQRSLLESNTALKERFNQSFSERPESVSAAQFTTQFWSTRLHLLRAHAIEKAQKAGEYNVLPEIKFVRVPGADGQPDQKRLNLTKEQIMLIFKQYSVVKQAYDENCPPLDQGSFWQRFFNSRLLKKLKGEKITHVDPPDGILDRYLDRQDVGPANISHIPHYIDLEGNEQNHSQRQGNRPDETMRPSDTSKVPILRVLNNLSEKMMSHVAQEDGEAHAPIGLDEETFEQLRLRDLALQDTDNRVKLDIREQQRFLSRGVQEGESSEARLYRKQDPRKVISSLRSDLKPVRLGADEMGCLRLDRAIDVNLEDDESDTEDAMSNGNTHFSSNAVLRSASNDVLKSIRQRRSLQSDDANNLHGLSAATFDSLAMTNNTTNEFLHYFWTLFLSGDASKAMELQGLITTLDRSLDRINAVSQAAEAERDKRVNKVKEQIRKQFNETGKKRKFDFESIEGGKKTVDWMIKPTVNALSQATEAYRKAFAEQTAAAAAVAAPSAPTVA